MAADHDLAGRLATLSERELAVLRLLARGHDAKSTAASLSITVNTANDRLREVRRKLGTSSSREAARLLLQHESVDARPKKIESEKIGLDEREDGAASSGQSDEPAASLQLPRSWFLGGFMLAAFTVYALLTLAGVTTPTTVPGSRTKDSTRHVAIFSDVPITFDGTYVRVPARLGSVETDLILDTAANATVISPVLRDALKLTNGVQVDVVGAGGQSQYEAVEIPRLWVGDIESRNVGAVVLDLTRFNRTPERPYGGILSNAFLKAHDVELNLPASRLRLGLDLLRQTPMLVSYSTKKVYFGGPPQ